MNDFTPDDYIADMIALAETALMQAPPGREPIAEAVKLLIAAVKMMHAELQQTRSTARTAANTAGCLANGTIPD